MNESKGILLIVLGVALIAASFAIKKFYAAKGLVDASPSDKTLPISLGRMIFWIAGGLMILVGFNLLSPNFW